MFQPIDQSKFGQQLTESDEKVLLSAATRPAPD